MAGAGVHSGADSGEGALLQRAGVRVHAELQPGHTLCGVYVRVCERERARERERERASERESRVEILKTC